ncbi:hypothetical protein AB0J83_11065 [Actinoplanes sp. NPDC049596]|uniref:hypothetical protein n=1 Tax=unclassified Actinoplanes TaxID=2626549 RepID=UPI00341E7D00
MPEMTAAERRWESWYQATMKMFAVAPQPIDVPCPEGDSGHLHLTFFGLPGSRTGSVKAWCDRGPHGIWLGRVGLPAGVEVHPFGSRPGGTPEIELIPEAWYTPDIDDEDDDLVP